MLVLEVNSIARCGSLAPRLQSRMAKKRKEPEPWQLSDAAKLKEIFDKKTNLTQEVFGDHYELGSQGLVWQYLNGHIPLSYESAYKFAKGLGCYIGDFSPRLARELELFSSLAVAPKKRAKREGPT